MNHILQHYKTEGYGKWRVYEALLSDMWRQHPQWPSTFSSCASEGCDNVSRGGGWCMQCLSEAMVALTQDPENVSLLVSGMEIFVQARSLLKESVE